MAMTKLAKNLIRKSPLLDDFAADSRVMTMADRDPGYPRSFERPAAADSGRVAMVEVQQAAESGVSDHLSVPDRAAARPIRHHSGPSAPQSWLRFLASTPAAAIFSPSQEWNFLSSKSFGGGLYPNSWGIYSQGDRRSPTSIRTDVPQDEKYHWYKIPAFELGPNTLCALFGEIDDMIGRDTDSPSKTPR